ncbi:MAG: hypothetical protein U5R06_03570 [candidate division KSB1 bacterium]|nr:hypothetical protein [candidate division KSB1 bacterium]
MLKGISQPLINMTPVASLPGRRLRTTMVAIDMPSLPGRGLCKVSSDRVFHGFENACFLKIAARDG